MSPRAIFDCMVFLQAVTNERGPAFACLRLVEQGQISLVISPQVLSEVQQVLGRSKVRAKFPHLFPATVERITFRGAERHIDLRGPGDWPTIARFLQCHQPSLR
jgi:predicted nucleic acid-binding protein